MATAKTTKPKAKKKAKEKPSQADTMKKYRDGYVPTKTAEGNHSKHCGDPVAEKLAGLTLPETLALAENVGGFKTGELAKKYAKLNPGSQRMNAGNRIRAAIKRGDVEIGAL